MTRDSLHNIQSYYQDFQHVFQKNLTPRILVTWSLWHFCHIYVYVNEKLVVFEQNCVYSQKPHFYTIKWNFENFRCSYKPNLQFKFTFFIQKRPNPHFRPYFWIIFIRKLRKKGWRPKSALNLIIHKERSWIFFDSN